MKRIAAVFTALMLLTIAAGNPAGAQDSPTPQASAASASASPAQLSEVMNKYADAIGGRKLIGSIRTQVSVFTFDLLGRTVVVRTTTKIPSFFLQETTAEGGTGKIVVGFDGKTAWSQGPDGVTKILSGDKRAEVVSDAAGGNDSELFPERWPTEVVLQPSETHDQKSYIVLSITAKGGITHDLLLDDQTYQPVIERTVEAGTTAISVVNSFSKGPLGELQPQSITTTRSDGFPQITATLQVVHDNVSVNDSIFAPPLGKGTETI